MNTAHFLPRLPSGSHAKLASATLLCLSLSACTVVPGSHFDSHGFESQKLTASSNKLAEYDVTQDDSIFFSVITPQTIKALSEQPKRSTNTTHDSDVRSSHLDPANVPYTYRLGISDVLSISVWGHPELNVSGPMQRNPEFDGYKIQHDGTLSYAYAPNVPAAGKTLIELREVLEATLANVIADPQVDVKIVAFNSQRAFITGAVNAPGVQPITDTPLTVLDALNVAGGLADDADWANVVLTRHGQRYTVPVNQMYVSGDTSYNVILQHGDVLHVPYNTKQHVYLLGEVKRAGKVAIARSGLSLAQALGELGGIDELRADGNGIFVLRNNADGEYSHIYQLEAENIAAYLLAERFDMQPQDVVYVTAAPVARWNRVLSQILPSLSSLRTLDDLASGD